MLLEGYVLDRDELLQEFQRAHAALARTCDGIPCFDQIRTRLPVAINQTTVTLVNSVDGREVPWPNAYSHILVGGEKLGRGYTVKGLTVTSIRQRARFFGYHRSFWVTAAFTCTRRCALHTRLT